MKHTPRKPGKINEDATNLAAVAAGIAAVIGSGVGIAGLMEYLKEKYPKAYKAMSELGAAAGDSRSRGVNKPDVNESAADIATVAGGIAAIVGSAVGIEGLMDYLKSKHPKAYKALAGLGAAAGDSRSRGVNKPDPDGMNESKGKIRLKTLSESLQEKGK